MDVLYVCLGLCEYRIKYIVIPCRLCSLSVSLFLFPLMVMKFAAYIKLYVFPWLILADDIYPEILSMIQLRKRGELVRIRYAV